MIKKLIIILVLTASCLAFDPYPTWFYETDPCYTVWYNSGSPQLADVNLSAPSNIYKLSLSSFSGFSTYFDQAVKTTSSPQFAGLGIGTVAVANQALTVIGGSSEGIKLSQGNDNAGINIFGYDDKITSYIKFRVDGSGQGQFVSSGNMIYEPGASSYIYFLSHNNIFLDLGDNAGVRSLFVRDSSANVLFSANSNGNIVIGSKTASSLTIGNGTAGIDYILKFDGETNDGILTWMEDEDRFQFADAVLCDLTLGVTGLTTTGGVEPTTDDTYYVGKNDDDSPKAFKGIILKDQTDGKYYRIELNSGAITVVDLTD
jgi:hypothetical protein